MSHQPYTYLIKFKETGQIYYGSRTAKNCSPDDLWVKYFTSSKYVNELIKEYGKDSFEILYTKNHPTKEAAINWEIMYLISVDAARNKNYLNRTNGSKNFIGREHSEEWKLELCKINSGSGNPFYGKTHTDEIREKIRNAQLGSTHTKEHCEKISNSMAGKNIKENNPMYGKIGSENSCSKKYIIIHPDGHEEIIIGLASYCRNNNLTQSAMTLVAQGKRTNHKNFKCIEIT